MFLGDVTLVLVTTIKMEENEEVLRYRQLKDSR